MDRTELVITVLGLLATFLLPWPLAGEPGDPGGESAQRAVAAEHSDSESMRLPTPADVGGAEVLLSAQLAR
jgi:hypothetical protein